jgi:hypothetical protein
MIDLCQPMVPFELELLRATCHRPAADHRRHGRSAGASRRAVEAIERQARERTEAELTLDGLPDLSAEGERDGLYQAQLIRELAVRHVTSWRG